MYVFYHAQLLERKVQNLKESFTSYSADSRMPPADNNNPLHRHIGKNNSNGPFREWEKNRLQAAVGNELGQQSSSQGPGEMYSTLYLPLQTLHQKDVFPVAI
jgi:hypothetical protein